MKAPLLSIIIPIFNAEKSIEQIVTNVLKQKMKDFELILIDDGSTDKSYEIIKKLAKGDDRIKILQQKNDGASSARNKGIKSARGKFIMFLDADDDIDPTMIVKMTDKIADEKVDLVTCSILFNYIRNNKVISQTNASPHPALVRSSNENFKTYIVRLIGTDGRLYNPCNKIYRGSIIRQNNLEFEVGLDFGEDLTFNLNYLNLTEKIAFIDEPLYIYNFNLAENTSGKSSLIYENRMKNFQTVVDFAGENPNSELSDLIGWIKYYWFYSFVLALCASSLSRRERIKRLKNALQIDTLPRLKDSQYIGKAKWRMTTIFYALRRNPRAIYSTVSTLNFCKNSRFFAMTWRKFVNKLLRSGNNEPTHS